VYWGDIEVVVEAVPVFRGEEVEGVREGEVGLLGK
jgi:hypothetical protein